MKDKVLFITGAASGIGKATVLEFLKQGAKVMLSDQDEEQGIRFTSELKNQGGDVAFETVDVCDFKNIEAAITQTLKKFKRIDYAFNNAGIASGRAGFVKDCPEEIWLKVIDVNLNGTFKSMKAELAPMLEQKSGVIINNASVLALVGFQAACSYSASKHGVIGLTKTAALEYSNQNIRINAICPGFIRTPMVEKMGEEAMQKLIKLHPINRLGLAEEVAKTVAFLCSDQATFICGASIEIDGGYSAQ